MFENVVGEICTAWSFMTGALVGVLQARIYLHLSEVKQNSANGIDTQ